MAAVVSVADLCHGLDDGLRVVGRRRAIDAAAGGVARLRVGVLRLRRLRPQLLVRLAAAIRSRPPAAAAGSHTRPWRAGCWGWPQRFMFVVWSTISFTAQRISSVVKSLMLYQQVGIAGAVMTALQRVYVSSGKVWAIKNTMLSGQSLAAAARTHRCFGPMTFPL